MNGKHALLSGGRPMGSHSGGANRKHGGRTAPFFKESDGAAPAASPNPPHPTPSPISTTTHILTSSVSQGGKGMGGQQGPSIMKQQHRLHLENKEINPALLAD